MSDPVLDAFLRAQLVQARRLAAESDLLRIQPEAGDAPRRYLVHFHGEGLVRSPEGAIQRTNHFVVGVAFPDDYLRGLVTHQLVTMLAPTNVWHPNVDGYGICLGKLPAGTGIVDLIFQVADIITFKKFSPHDGISPAACEWARHQPRGTFPIDRRPLKWRAPAEGAVR